jgi:hypothetical protein
MRKTIFIGFIAVVSSLVLSASSFASVIYSDSTSFNAVLGTTVVDDYENNSYTFVQNNAAMTNVLGETSYNSTGFGNHNIVAIVGSTNHLYCAGCNGSFLLDFTSTSVSGANGVFGVGFDFFNAGNPSYFAMVTYGDNSTEDIALPNAFSSGLQFWGITSALEISSIHFGLINGGTTQNGSFGIDNLTIGNPGTNVPEPTSVLLFGLGLLGLCAARKRKSA